MPLVLGGASNDPSNLWSEPGASPNPKDELEERMDSMVCAGEFSLSAAREEIARNWGLSTVRTVDRLVFTANGRGRVVDELLLEDVIVAVGRICLPASLDTEPEATQRDAPSAGHDGPESSDAAASGSAPLEQLRRLGELRASAVLTDAEFEAKKAELLRRI